MESYQGQLWGGPDHGNIVSSVVGEVKFEQATALWLDGSLEKPSVNSIKGAYVWNPEKERFDWEGPGADGDTIERLRLR